MKPSQKSLDDFSTKEIVDYILSKNLLSDIINQASNINDVLDSIDTDSIRDYLDDKGFYVYETEQEMKDDLDFQGYYIFDDEDDIISYLKDEDYLVAEEIEDIINNTLDDEDISKILKTIYHLLSPRGIRNKEKMKNILCEYIDNNLIGIQL